MKCVICGNEIDLQFNEDGKVTWSKGHNAEPVESGRCCSTCNYTVVLPVRITKVFPTADDEQLADLCKRIKRIENG
jgi:hypothetical protein